jgi:3-oxoacyl-[acyl-carrier protein] reductase
MKTVPNYPVGKNLLAGKTVLVTAAAGTGIGYATAQRCAEEGAAKMVISDIHERRLNEAAERVEAATGMKPGMVLCNVTKEEDVQNMFASAIEQMGHIDVLMNNAGLGGTKDVVDMTDDEWNVVLDVTLTGTFRCTRAALKHMYARKSGAIVNNASVLGWRAQKGQAHYAAAKAGVMAFTRCSRGGSRGPQRAHQRDCAELGEAPVLGEGDDQGAARGARVQGGVWPRGRALGDGEHHDLPGQRLRVVPDRVR